MDKTFDTGFQLNKCAIIGDVGNAAFHFRPNWEFAFDIFPWIRQKLLHAKRNTLGFSIKANDLNLDSFTNLQGLRWMADALPCNIGHMQQAVNTAKIDKGAVIGDVLDHTLKNLTFLQIRDKL